MIKGLIDKAKEIVGLPTSIQVGDRVMRKVPNGDRYRIGRVVDIIDGVLAVVRFKSRKALKGKRSYIEDILLVDVEKLPRAKS